MKIALICLLIIGVVAAEVSDAEWNAYKEKFNKNYPDAAEDDRHRGIYCQTKSEVIAHNKKFDAGEVSFSLGINQFADMSREEMKNTAFGLNPPKAGRASLRGD